MRFKTRTSEYEINADEFGVMTLKKISMKPECNSLVEVGREFHAKRGDAIVAHMVGGHQLLFGSMQTSPVVNHEELSQWLEDNRKGG